LISIPSTNALETIHFHADCIGIIFPVYHATFNEKGLPYLVEAFVRKIQNLEGKFVFCICTHSGSPGFTIENLNQLLVDRGGKISAAVALKLGNPFSPIEKIGHMLFDTPLKTHHAQEDEKRSKLMEQGRNATSKLHYAIIRKEETGISKTNRISKSIKLWFFSMQRRMAIRRYQQLSKLQSVDFRELSQHADRSFTVSSRCNACGICQKICPASNIRMVDKKPKWLNHCENCYACFQWCPQEAIGGKIVEFEKRYYQPSISVADL
jgi:formate hydrogenlyase subunit 6/NADH:ubiquinone oxidoreductase subunit I